MRYRILRFLVCDKADSLQIFISRVSDLMCCFQLINFLIFAWNLTSITSKTWIPWIWKVGISISNLSKVIIQLPSASETHFLNSLSPGSLPSASFLKCKNFINSLENQASAREKLKFYPREKNNILAQLRQKFYQRPDLPQNSLWSERHLFRGAH